MAPVKFHYDFLTDKDKKVLLQDHKRDFYSLAIVSGQASLISRELLLFPVCSGVSGMGLYVGAFFLNRRGNILKSEMRTYPSLQKYPEFFVP